MGSGCTGNVRFWLTPASSHQMRLVSGSSLSKARTPWIWRIREPPAADVMGARDDAGAQTLGHPRAVHEGTDGRLDLEQIAGLDAQPARVLRVHPDRIGVRQLRQP